MAFLLFQRCGEILFENPDQNVKCVCMLGKKPSYFIYIKYVDVTWTSCYSVTLLTVSCCILQRPMGFFNRCIDRDSTFICGTLDDKKV